MAAVTVTVEGLDQLRANFKKYPDVSKKYLNKAIAASIILLERNADDSGDSKLFQFKTPRAKRTGMLALSFKQGMKFGDLYGEIGPTVNYAPYVYYGTKRSTPNPYMDRIAKASEKDISTFFADALKYITEDISKI